MVVRAIVHIRSRVFLRVARLAVRGRLVARAAARRAARRDGHGNALPERSTGRTQASELLDAHATRAPRRHRRVGSLFTDSGVCVVRTDLLRLHKQKLLCNGDGRTRRSIVLSAHMAVVCAMRLLCSALGFYLQTMPYEYTRNLTKGLFADVALHVLLQASNIFFIWYCWPHGSMPFWQYFWAVVIVLNAVTSVIYSLLAVFSALCTVYCTRVLFKSMKPVVLGIKMLWMLVLIVFSLWLFALVSANEWNALTLVMLIGFDICQGFSVWLIANGLWIACRKTASISRHPVTENLYQMFVHEVHVAGPQGCGLCGCSFRMDQFNELQIERFACDEGRTTSTPRALACGLSTIRSVRCAATRSSPRASASSTTSQLRFGCSRSSYSRRCLVRKLLLWRGCRLRRSRRSSTKKKHKLQQRAAQTKLSIRET